MTTHTYTAYGLNFACEFPLPEFSPHRNGAPDVRIGYGNVPESLPSLTDNGIAWQAAPGKLLLTVDGIARYLIVGDSEVIVEPLVEDRQDDVRFFLLGFVLGALLHARRMLVLHGSVVQTEHGAVIFAGDCGAGKSTLLGAFLKRGYAMLADDKAGIVLDKDGKVQVLPGFPRVRLTKRAVKKLEFPVRENEFNEGLEKYIIPIEKFCAEPLPVKAVYSLNVHNKTDIILEPLQRLEQFETLNYYTYRRRFSHEASQRRAHFQILNSLSKQTRVVRVTRPEHPVLIDELVGRVVEDFAR